MMSREEENMKEKRNPVTEAGLTRKRKEFAMIGKGETMSNE